MSHGTITWGCAHVDGRVFCPERGAYSLYGMVRCLRHAVELSPCTWEANMRDGVCVINHARLGPAFNPLCRNTRKELTR